MAPDERRAALIVATLPLLREHGAAVTTRQIADAAGVAEGTIFGVFPDKASLILASVLSAFDPERWEQTLHGLMLSGDLRQRLTSTVELLARRMEANGPLLAIARSLPPAAAGELFQRLGRGRKHVQDTIAAIIEPDRAQLRQSPETAARLLLSLVFAASHDEFSGAEALDSEELVAVLLDGLLIRPDTTTDPGDLI